MALEIFVLGPGVGESIAVSLPNGEWGVVDAYGDPAPDADSEILHLLRSRGVQQLRFLCWTHPHDDHSSGLPSLLAEFRGRVQELWRFDSPAPQKMFAGVAARQAKAKLPDSYLIGVAREFTRRPSRVKLVRSDQLLLADQAAALEIRGLCPSDRARLIYEGQIGRYGASFFSGETRRPPDDNLISAALWIRYGATQVILGGDVTAPAWKSARQQASDWPSGVHLVKASHHGSRHSYDEGLWDEWARKRNGGSGTIIAVTPFTSVKVPLPTRVGRRLLGKHGEVVVTGLPASTPGSEHQSEEWSMLRRISDPNPAATGNGHFRVCLNDRGEIVSRGFF